MQPCVVSGKGPRGIPGGTPPYYWGPQDSCAPHTVSLDSRLRNRPGWSGTAWSTFQGRPRNGHWPFLLRRKPDVVLHSSSAVFHMKMPLNMSCFVLLQDIRFVWERGTTLLCILLVHQDGSIRDKLSFSNMLTGAGLWQTESLGTRLVFIW